MIHELKCWPKYFQPVIDGRKTFEIRNNDRNFHDGDILFLREWEPIRQDYTGRNQFAVVTYLAVGGVIPEGFAAMSIVKAKLIVSDALPLAEKEQK